jgi:rsbT co-antagonist protein RsbR
MAEMEARLITEEMGITQEEVARRKEFLELGDKDVERLRRLHGLAVKYADSVIEQFYDHLLRFDESRAFFNDPAVLERVKAAQKRYFLELTQGMYDVSYVESRLKIGLTHERINLPVKLYLGMYSFYLRAIASRFLDAQKDNPTEALLDFLSVLKLVFFDMGLAIETYIHQREDTILSQQEAIRELSTPVLRLRNRLLIMPIIGVIDSHRANQLTEQLLQRIRTDRAKVVVMDITGVPTVDSAVANHLIQAVQASRLMGATVIVTGLSAEVAQTLVRLGVDLTKVRTVGDLQEGIEEAEQLLGYQLTRVTTNEKQNESA